MDQIEKIETEAQNKPEFDHTPQRKRLPEIEDKKIFAKELLETEQTLENFGELGKSLTQEFFKHLFELYTSDPNFKEMLQNSREFQLFYDEDTNQIILYLFSEEDEKKITINFYSNIDKPEGMLDLIHTLANLPRFSSLSETLLTQLTQKRYTPITPEILPQKLTQTEEGEKEEKLPPIVPFPEIKERVPEKISKPKGFDLFEAHLNFQRELPEDKLRELIKEDSEKLKEILERDKKSKKDKKEAEQLLKSLFASTIALFEKYKTQQDQKHPFKLFESQLINLYEDISFILDYKLSGKPFPREILFHKLRVSGGKTSVLIPILSSVLTDIGETVYIQTINIKLKEDTLEHVKNFFSFLGKGQDVYEYKFEEHNLQKQGKLYIRDLLIKTFKEIKRKEAKDYLSKYLQNPEDQSIPEEIKKYLKQKISEKERTFYQKPFLTPNKVWIGEAKDFIFARLEELDTLSNSSKKPWLLIDEFDHMIVNEAATPFIVNLPIPISTAQYLEEIIADVKTAYKTTKQFSSEEKLMPPSKFLKSLTETTVEKLYQDNPEILKLIPILKEFTQKTLTQIVEKKPELNFLLVFEKEFYSAKSQIKGKDYDFIIEEKNGSPKIKFFPIEKTGYWDTPKRFSAFFTFTLLAKHKEELIKTLSQKYPSLGSFFKISKPTRINKILINLTELSMESLRETSIPEYYFSRQRNPAIGFSGTLPFTDDFQKHLGIRVVDAPPPYIDNRRDFLSVAETEEEKISTIKHILETTPSTHKIIVTFDESEASQIIQNLPQSNIFLISPKDAHEQKHNEILQDFANKGGILVVPRMIYRGVDIDFPENTLLISSSIFSSKEDLQQTLGRVGRKGKKAITHTIISPIDKALNNPHIDPETLKDMVTQLQTATKNFKLNPSEKNKKKLLATLNKTWEKMQIDLVSFYYLSLERVKFQTLIRDLSHILDEIRGEILYKDEGKDENSLLRIISSKELALSLSHFIREAKQNPDEALEILKNYPEVSGLIKYFIKEGVNVQEVFKLSESQAYLYLKSHAYRNMPSAYSNALFDMIQRVYVPFALEKNINSIHKIIGQSRSEDEVLNQLDYAFPKLRYLTKLRLYYFLKEASEEEIKNFTEKVLNEVDEKFFTSYDLVDLLDRVLDKNIP